MRILTIVCVGLFLIGAVISISTALSVTNLTFDATGVPSHFRAERPFEFRTHTPIQQDDEAYIMWPGGDDKDRCGQMGDWSEPDQACAFTIEVRPGQDPVLLVIKNVCTAGGSTVRIERVPGDYCEAR